MYILGQRRRARPEAVPWVAHFIGRRWPQEVVQRERADRQSGPPARELAELQRVADARLRAHRPGAAAVAPLPPEGH